VARICDQLAISNALAPRWGAEDRADSQDVTRWDSPGDADDTQFETVEET
jgi:hypothetical protein